MNKFYKIERQGVIVEQKPWETSILGFKTANLSFPSKNEDTKKAFEILINNFQASNERWFLSARIPADDIFSLRLLEAAGFKLMETYLLFKHDLKYISETNSDNIEICTEKDIEKIANIAYNSFRYSRFHIDDDIPDNLADETRRQWVINSCKGRAKRIYLARIDKNIAGFVLCKEKNNTGVLDLIAVDNNFRGRNLGYLLTLEFLKFCKENNYDYALVGTQAHNIASVRLYEKAGFRLFQTFYTFHKHIK